jgi:glycosyltransferase involved in cell wall biosynthesis
MACGTPVIVMRRGSAPEIVVDGETGFVVDTIEEMVAAIERVPSIDPLACREHVARNFSPPLMAAAYLRAYERVMNVLGTVPAAATRSNAEDGRTTPLAVA